MLFGFWDMTLVGVVTVQAMAVAYLSTPRWKGLALSLPLPFTTIVLSLDKPVDASNVLSLATLLVYVTGVWVLYEKARFPIVPAVALSVVAYILLGGLLLGFVPKTDTAFWLAIGAMFALGQVLLRVLPRPCKPPYRTPMPLWQKLPTVLAVVGVLVTIKSHLGGFASLFPLLGTVGAYEVRHDLWILVRSVPVLMCSLTVLLGVTHVGQAAWGLGGGLALGWLAFLPIVLWIQVRVRRV
ncbi:MAG: hypothetical protein O3B73_17010 [bacterium]|jgi:hypothetical protein|nr:hypothetical protein [bacterium]